MNKSYHHSSEPRYRAASETRIELKSGGKRGQRRLEGIVLGAGMSAEGGGGWMIESQAKGKRAHPAGILAHSRNWNLT